MGGKKKKSLANKLAKMSDEERARYLQHRAEMEEEAKRRKEQLIATFMKKKIKKEEAFARLNQSKINQNWHQILRKIKVQEMREEVEHLRKWIDRVIIHKNKTITKLLEQLEEAEIHYIKNFTTHATHVDEMIENQNKYINKLQSQYEEELDDLREITNSERTTYVINSHSEIDYLKTVIFGQTTEASIGFSERQEYYNLQLYECDYNNRTKVTHLKKTRQETEFAIWCQILSVVKLYIQRTDVRRGHLAELKRVDTENSVKILNNEERNKKSEKLIETLKSTSTELLQASEGRMHHLETEEKNLNQRFLKIKKQLKDHIDLDNKQLRLMTAISNQTLHELKNILKKGQFILSLSNTCKKFETEREKIAKYLPCLKSQNISTEVLEETTGDDLKEIEEKVKMALTDDEKLYQKEVAKGFAAEKHVKPSSSKRHHFKVEENVPAPVRSKLRPKSFAVGSTSAKSVTNSTPVETSEISTPEKLKAIEDVTIEEKKTYEEAIASSTSKSDEKEDVLTNCYESLKNVEHFWFMYNKVEVDVMEIKEEKRVLIKQNKQLRGLIRAVLESAALAKSLPESRISTRVSSKRSASSAPIRRITFN